jgi:glycosyltransferase involved in cell wall biosynthesis
MTPAKPVIAMVTDAIAPYHRGGKEQRYEELAPRLQRYADVHVYTMNWWKGPRTTARAGVTYHAICPFVPLYRGERRSIAQALLFALACFRLLFERFDVLEADHMPYLQLFPLKVVALLRRKRLVVTWHEVWNRAQWREYLGPAGLVAWWLERAAMRLPDCIIAASAHTAESLRGRVPSGLPVVIAPSGIDLDLILRTPPAGDGVDIVSVGRLLRHKRFDLLLECVAQLASSGKEATCRIIGDGPERQALIRQASRLGIAHLVDFRHDVNSTAELLSLVKASRLFVFPSEREGFGIAALEAIGCGSRVITTTAPNNLARHLVARSARGVICEPTARALAVAVESALSDREEGCEPNDDWLGEHDWNAIAERIAHALVPEAPHVAPVPARQTARAVMLPPIAGGSAALRETLELPPSLVQPGRLRGELPDLLASLLAVAAMASLASVRGVWALQVAEFFLLLSVPGLLLVRAVRASPDAVLGFPIYILCGSIAVIMGSGLLVDLVGPAVGISRPLATVPLTASISLVCLVLIAVAAAGKAPSLRAYLSVGVRAREMWPLALPVIAWAGATRLTNGHGAATAIVAVGATGLALLVAVWRGQRWSVRQLAMLVYGASLALMWGFSLRGHFVYGFDISGEYQTFTQVLHAGRWYVSHRDDAYGATLSLTILPSTLAGLTGASPLLILKAIYPLLFAFFPVGVFLVATRVLSRRFAYLGVLFIVVQAYLFQQLPAIARQEIALLFFVCLVGVMLDGRLRRGARLALLAVFAVGLVFSHYGTAYLTVGLLAISLVVEFARGRLTSTPPRAALVPIAVALAITGGAAALWYAPITNSTQNLSQFISDLNRQGLSILPNAGGQGLLKSYLAGNVATRVSAGKFAALAQQDYVKNRPYVHPLRQAGRPAFRLQDASVPGQRVVSHPILRGLDAAQVIVSQLAILLAAFGALLLWIRRGAGDTARGLAVLATSTLVILVVIRLSGTAANDYNQDRAFLQAMVPLSFCLAWALQWASGHRRLGRLVPGVFALGLTLVFLTTSGLRGVAIGGGTPTNLATQGEDFERYYVTVPELSAARWLNASAPQGDIVSADRYGQLRIFGATGRLQAVLAALTPLTLDRHAWIYADTANFLGHRARGQEGSQYGIYAWPAFVARYWNLVYSNGSSAVYARTH